MNIGILVSGSLRTFFMDSLYENFTKNIIDCNSDNIHIFFYTDTNDFYYKGIQYYTDSKVDNFNGDIFRVHSNIKYISINEAENLIKEAFDGKFTNYTLNIREYVEPSISLCENKLHKTFVESKNGGSNQLRCLSQFKKVKDNYKILSEYEIVNDIKFDVIFKTRFDMFYQSNLVMGNYDFVDSNLYVPGIPAIGMSYDWFAIGNRYVMEKYCNIYDYFGITDVKKSILSECACINNIIPYVQNLDVSKCEFCGGIKRLTDITNSAELTIGYYMNESGINLIYNGPSSFVYRYRN